MKKMTGSSKGTPLYIQIREAIRHDILNDVYKPGDRIPSEHEIADMWNANRHTARNAITKLVNEGLLIRRPGVGTFVARKRLLDDHNHIASFWESAVAAGLNPSNRVIETTIILATADLANLLEIEDGNSIFKIQRVRLLNNEPVSFHINHIPTHLMPDLLDHDLANESLYRIYSEKGLHPTSGQQKIKAALAGERIGSLLEIPPGSPVLTIARVTRGIYGKPIEYTITYNRADRYEVTMTVHA
jgi:GntR family transcriptional regulator